MESVAFVSDVVWNAEFPGDVIDDLEMLSLPDFLRRLLIEETGNGTNAVELTSGSEVGPSISYDFLDLDLTNCAVARSPLRIVDNIPTVSTSFADC